MKAGQLSLFDERLHQQLNKALTDIAWLKERLDTAKVEFRKLRDQQATAPCPQCQAFQQTVKDLTHQLTQAQRERDSERRWAEMWRGLLDLHRQEQFQGGHPPGSGPSRDHLTALLKVAHPDKWSQGQPATQLAHELSVAINALRAEAQGETEAGGKRTAPRAH